MTITGIRHLEHAPGNQFMAGRGMGGLEPEQVPRAGFPIGSKPSAGQEQAPGQMVGHVFPPAGPRFARIDPQGREHAAGHLLADLVR